MKFKKLLLITPVIFGIVIIPTFLASCSSLNQKQEGSTIPPSIENDGNPKPPVNDDQIPPIENNTIKTYKFNYRHSNGNLIVYYTKSTSKQSIIDKIKNSGYFVSFDQLSADKNNFFNGSFKIISSNIDIESIEEIS